MRLAVSGRCKEVGTWCKETLYSHDHDNLEGAKAFETHLSTTVDEIEEFADEDQGSDTDVGDEHTLSDCLYPADP